jgi:hypothetical protein
MEEYAKKSEESHSIELWPEKDRPRATCGSHLAAGHQEACHR